VKELSKEEYMKVSGRKGFLSGWITDTEILFVKGDSIIFLSLEQLQQILDLLAKEA